MCEGSAAAPLALPTRNQGLLKIVLYVFVIHCDLVHTWFRLGAGVLEGSGRAPLERDPSPQGQCPTRYAPNGVLAWVSSLRLRQIA